MNSNQNFLEVCLEAVQVGGQIAKSYFGKTNQSRKDDNTVVTEADLKAEQKIRKIIKAKFPNHKILGEEFGGDLSPNDYTWIIDPIDGTNNYANGNPIYCCGIALAKNNQIICSALFMPENDKIYYSTKTDAFLNNKKIPQIPKKKLNKAKILTSRPSKYKEPFEQLTDSFKKSVSEVSFIGSGLCSMAEVADNSVDGMVCYVPKVWDVAPAVQIATQAGAVALDFSGKDWKLGKADLILAHPSIAHNLAKLTNETNFRKVVLDLQ